MEDQAFSPTYGLASPSTPSSSPSPVSKLSLLLSLSVCRKSSNLAYGRGGGISNDGEKAWSSASHSTLSGKLCEWKGGGRTTSIFVNHLPHLIAAVTVRRSLGCCSTTLGLFSETGFHYGMERNFVCSWRRPNCRSQVIDLSLSLLISRRLVFWG
jgi:hypothetical protein